MLLDQEKRWGNHYFDNFLWLRVGLPVFVFVKVRPFDVEEPGKDVDEDLPHPGSHLVRLRTSEMNVEYQDCHADTGIIIIINNIIQKLEFQIFD